MLKRYLLNTSGNFGIMFALFSTILGFGVAVAIDVSGMTSQKSTLQSMSDAAVLAAVSSGEDDLDTLKEIVEEYLAINNVNGLDFNWNLSVQSDEVILSIASVYDAKLAGFIGESEFDVGVVSAAPFGGGSGPLNMSLVLDSTGSMAGANMDALQIAANNMIDSIEASGADVHMSVVPFATYVNVGVENRDEAWMNVPADYDIPRTTRDLINESLCTFTPGTRTRDGVTVDEIDEHCPEAAYGPEYTDFRTHFWGGCAGSRSGIHQFYPEYGVQAIPGQNHYSCNTPMLPLTNNYADIRSTIDNMDPKNETYIPSGLIWGWRTLDPQVPFNEASLLSGDRTRAMVLMSDGANTQSKGARTSTEQARPEADAFHEIDDGEPADTLTAELCANIKADNIRLFVIAYRLNGSASFDTHNTLRSCASSSTDFYDANNAGQLDAAFDSIVNAFSDKVRLSR